MKSNILFLQLLILANLTCNKQDHESAKQVKQKMTVKVIEIVPSQFTSKGFYFGRLTPLFSAKIISYTGGRVESIKVREGDFVQKGTSLAEIDIEKASTVFQTAKAHERIARFTLKQARIHLETGNVSQLRVDEAERNYLEAANNRIIANKNYQGAVAMSPINGVVTYRNIQLNEEIPEGAHIFTVSEMNEMKANINVVESDVYYLKVGTRARLFVDMIPEKHRDGTVKYFAREADEKSRGFRTEIFFDNHDGVLKPGTVGKIEIDLQSFDSSVVVPTELITVRGIQKSVMVVRPDNRAERRFIETGSQSGTLTLVYTGLSFGDYVISDGHNMVGDGDEVIVVNDGEK
ncbi:MAG: efflux RND transporter periplasmic adaptor subunit [Fibrobacter sp.]|nr:efflux RND transporter periplasmic adaptor subunit [Fibrobacter sp.]